MRSNVLPVVPREWVERIGAEKWQARHINNHARIADLERWLTERPNEGVCSALSEARDKLMELLDSEDENAHDLVNRRLYHLVSLAAEGHRGIVEVLGELELYYVDVTYSRRVTGKAGNKPATKEPRDAPEEAQAEFLRSRDGAVRILMDDEYLGEGCYCIDEHEQPEGEHEPGFHAKPKDPAKYDQTDVGLAEHMVDLHYGDLAYLIDTGKWATWNGLRWEQTESVWSQAKDVGYRLRDACARMGEQVIQLAESGDDQGAKELDKKRTALFKTYVQSHQSPGIKRIIEMAREDIDVRFRQADFDRDDHLLGVANGLLVLNGDGEILLRPATRKDRITRACRAEYQKGATHPDFNFYLEYFLPDPDVRAMAQKFLGYSLHGKNPEKVLGFFLGTGNTGKSSLLEWGTAALGEYGDTFTSSIFRAKDDGSPRPDIIAVKKLRLATTSEFSEHTVLHADQIKKLVGEDTIPARTLYQKDFDYSVPDFTPAIASNSIPKIQGADQALRNRLLVFPFDNVMSPGSRGFKSPGEISVLKQDPAFLAAVLAWMAEGWTRYAEEGFKRVPDVMLRKADEFMSGSSTFHDWFNEGFVKDPRGQVCAGDIWPDYQLYCMANNVPQKHRVESQTALGRKLTDLGFVAQKVPRRVDGRKQKVRTGYRWRSKRVT